MLAAREISELSLEIRKMHKQFPGVKALDDVNFSVRKGEIHALIGKNGAGKSTLIKILSGAYKADSGDMYINGNLVTIDSPQKANQCGIATVYQDFSLTPTLTVAENIFLGRFPKRGLGNSRIDYQKLNQQAACILDSLNAGINPRTPVAALSVPEKQIVEIAKALSNDASIILFDEPTAALAQDDVKRLLNLIKSLAARGVTIIYVSHRIVEIHQIAERASVLRDGKLVGVFDLSECGPEKIVGAMVGSEMEKISVDVRETSNDVMLSLRDLSFKDKVKNVSFDLHKGEVLGLAGVMGAGRSEIVKCIFGLERPDHGTILIKGQLVDKASPRKLRSLGVGFTPEDRKADGLVSQMCVKDNVTLACLDEITDKGVIDKPREKSIVKELINRLAIVTVGLDVSITNLSGGNQQKCLIGRWLAIDPDVLILDEPTKGIDVEAKTQIYKLLRKLSLEGMSIIFISSELEELVAVCDRVITLYSGKIVGEHKQPNIMLESLAQGATGVNIK